MRAQDIVLSPAEHTELSRRIRSATICQRDGRRARVILLAAQGCSRVEISRLVGFSLGSVRFWCQRFQDQRLDGLIDKPGRGRKPSLSPEAIIQVLENGVQPRVGQPRWSCRSMARAVGISPASVQRIWAANDVKPHLERPFKRSNATNCMDASGTSSGSISCPPI